MAQVESEYVVAGRTHFFSTFTIIALILGLTTVTDPQAVAGLLIGIGKALLIFGLMVAFMWLLIAASYLASLIGKG